MRRLTFLIIMAGICASGAFAAKAYHGTATVKQKDGKSITIRQHGDADFHYVTTTDGVLLWQDGYDYYIATVDGNGELQPTDVLAHNAGQRTAQELKLIQEQQRDLFHAKEHRVRQAQVMTRAGDIRLFPHTGSPKAMVILADFADWKFKYNDEDTKSVFNAYLNAEGKPSSSIDAAVGKNYGSVRRYFSDMSFGQFTPQFDIVAVVHLTGNMSKYGSGKSDDMYTFIPEVCQLAHDQGVDFSQYDADNDGFVDLLYIIYAGYGQNWSGNSSDCIWPKSGSISTGNTYDGKRIYRYGVNNEINFNPEITREKFDNDTQINGVGVFCHEMSHTMGLPDFYPITTAAQNVGNPAMEYWDIMDGGEYLGNCHCPTAYTAWEREHFGWMEMTTLTEADYGRQIELKNIDQGGKAYRVYLTDESGSEYIFIQNIQKYAWNQSLANYGHGMLVTRVDYKESIFVLGGAVNDVIGKSRMTVVPADGICISYYLVDTSVDDEKDLPSGKYTAAQYEASLGGDPFPGTGNVTKLESIQMNNGTMKKPLLNITEDDEGIVRFDFYEEGGNGILQILDDNRRTKAIYTIDGRYAGTNREALPKGIYIINSKKVVVP